MRGCSGWRPECELTYPLSCIDTGLIDFGVHRLATQGMDVVIKHLLQVNQANQPNKLCSNSSRVKP